MENRHGGLWNSVDYDTRDVVSIDMKACYPAYFQGMGEANPYFERFGPPTHHMTHVAINGALPRDVGYRLRGGQRIGVRGYLSSCHPCLVWKAFCRCRLGPDAVLGVPCGVWLAEDSQSQGSD